MDIGDVPNQHATARAPPSAMKAPETNPAAAPARAKPTFECPCREVLALGQGDLRGRKNGGWRNISPAAGRTGDEIAQRVIKAWMLAAMLWVVAE